MDSLRNVETDEEDIIKENEQFMKSLEHFEEALLKETHKLLISYYKSRLEHFRGLTQNLIHHQSSPSSSKQEIKSKLFKLEVSIVQFC